MVTLSKNSLIKSKLTGIHLFVKWTVMDSLALLYTLTKMTSLIILLRYIEKPPSNHVDGLLGPRDHDSIIVKPISTRLKMWCVLTQDFQNGWLIILKSSIPDHLQVRHSIESGSCCVLFEIMLYSAP